MSLTSVDVPLFEGLEVPRILHEDSPRAGLRHPVQSHMAADRSQPGLKDAKRRVLRLVANFGPQVPGTVLNEVYPEYARKNGWKRLAYDSPRKRAGELAVEKFLTRDLRDSAGNHRPEGLYSLTPKGIAALAAERSL